MVRKSALITKIPYLFIVFFITLVMSGCFEEKTRSVEWYKSHQSAREKQIQACSKDYSAVKNKENCRYAATAAAQAHMESIHKTVTTQK